MNKDMLWNMLDACIKLAIATVKECGTEWEHVKKYDMLDDVPMFYLPISSVIPDAFHESAVDLLSDVLKQYPDIIYDEEGGWLKFDVSIRPN